METFKPKGDPWYKVFLGNIWVQISGLFLLVAGSYLFIKGDPKYLGNYFGFGSNSSGLSSIFVSSKSTNRNPAAEDVGSTEATNTNNQTEPTFIESSSTTLSTIAGLANDSTANNSDIPATTATANSATSSTATQNPGPLFINEVKLPANSKAVQVDLIEISKNDFMNFYKLAATTNNAHMMDKLLAVIIPADKIKDLIPLQRLHSFLKINEPRMIADYPMVSPSNAASNIIGLFLDFSASIEANGNGGHHITFNGVIDERLKEQMSEYPFSIELEEKEALLLSGPLAINTVKNVFKSYFAGQPDEDVTAIQSSHPFFIFKSKEFQNGQSQFTILVQFSKN